MLLHLFTCLLLFYAELSKSEDQTPQERIDCAPEGPLTTTECKARGCLFESTDDPETPWCFFPLDVGYVVDEIRTISTHSTTEAKLTRNIKYSNFTLFGDDFNQLKITIIEESSYRVRIRIEPDGVQRFEPPVHIFPPADDSDESQYTIEILEDPIFSLKITRKSSGTVIFDTSLPGLIFSNQFIQLPIRLPSYNLYGIGEHEQHSFRHNFDKRKTWPLFAADEPPWGEPVYRFNLYGTHPRYTVVEDDGNTHGVVFINSAAQEFETLPLPGLVYRTIGGLLDFYVFLGPGPEEVVEQYTEAVGRYYIPPYWSLGYHQCRWGYNTLAHMRAAWDRTVSSGIPVDAQWGDIDIMERKLDFTVDGDSFAGLSEFVVDIKQSGYKFVTILDPGVSNIQPEGEYPPFESGQKASVWINGSDDTPFQASVWPGPVYFVDFTNPDAQVWWIEEIKNFHRELEWDGLWIDMNEPSNFVNGDLEKGGCKSNTYNLPPYKTHLYGHAWWDGTVCADAKQHAGLHYDLHNLYGWSQTLPTLQGVQSSTGSRGLVLSRSTFVGSGRWAAHWLGDNWSLWSNLHYSIIGILQFNQFGIPFVGADICGFSLLANPEMCTRWHQLGAFYPFSRNHNNINNIDQDPGVFGEEAVSAIRDVLNLRYYLLPYLYTLFYRHHVRGSTVARPLWHEFAEDKDTLNIDTQFMLGSDLMVCPVLSEGFHRRTCYFPDSLWYEGFNLLQAPGPLVPHRGENAIVEMPLDKTGVFFRGGSIIPTQQPGINTAKSRENPLDIFVFLNEYGTAYGELYLDDGDSIDPVQRNAYSLTKMQFATNTLAMSSDLVGYLSLARVQNVWIVGLTIEVTDVILVDEDGNELGTTWTNAADNSVHISDLNMSILNSFKIQLY